MSNYQPTPEDRFIISQIPTEVLLNTVCQQLVPEIVEIMVDELNGRYQVAEDLAVAESWDDFNAELNSLMAELERDLTVEPFGDDSDDYGWEF